MYTKEQTEQAETYLQKIMNDAYDKWVENGNWRKNQFWLHLTYLQKVAVWTGNLNYQVHNGGFSQ